MKKAILLAVSVFSFFAYAGSNHSILIDNSAVRLVHNDGKSVYTIFQVCLRDAFSGTQLTSAPIVIRDLNQVSGGSKLEAISDETGCVRWTGKLSATSTDTVPAIFSVKRQNQDDQVHIGFIVNTQDWKNPVQATLLEK